MPTTLAVLPAARRRFRMSFVLVMLFHSQYNRSGHNQKPAGAADQSETLAEKERGKQDDEGDTQLVDRGNARGFAKLERAKVAEPRQAGGQAGQAREWAAKDKSASLLPRGIALASIEDKVASARAAGLGGLGEPAEEFLSAACRQRARASVRQRFRIASVTAVIATVVIASVIVLQVRAADSRNLTLAQSRAETSQLIESANQSANDPVLSLLLDVEAYRVGGATADNGLLSAQEDFFTSTLSNPAGAGSAVAFDTAAPLLAVAGQDAMTVFLVTTQQRAVTLRGGSPFYAAAFNPSG